MDSAVCAPECQCLSHNFRHYFEEDCGLVTVHNSPTKGSRMHPQVQQQQPCLLDFRGMVVVLWSHMGLYSTSCWILSRFYLRKKKKWRHPLKISGDKWAHCVFGAWTQIARSSTDLPEGGSINPSTLSRGSPPQDPQQPFHLPHRQTAPRFLGL